MSQLNFDATTVDPTSTYDTFPKGDYTMCIRETEVKPTKAGTGHLLAYTAEVLDGPHAGRKVLGNMNIANPNPEATAIGQRELSQLCHAVGKLQVADSVELHDLPFLARVGIEVDKTGQYDDKNTIKQFKPMPQAGALAGQAAPAAPQTVAAPAAVVAPAVVAPAVVAPVAAPAGAPAVGAKPGWAG